MNIVERSSLKKRERRSFMTKASKMRDHVWNERLREFMAGREKKEIRVKD